MKKRAAVGLLAAIWIVSSTLALDTDPKQILDKVAEQYKAMQTYKSEGTVVVDMETENMKMHMETAFSIKLKKPNLYLITWTQKGMPMPGMEQSGAVWNTGGQPYLYMGIMKAYSKIKGDEMALGAATGISGGAAHTIPSLFFSLLSPKLGAPHRLTDPMIEKTETLDGEECCVISGSSVASKKETFWIATNSHLIKQYSRSLEPPEGSAAIPEMTDQQLDEAIKGMGQQASPESRAKMRDMMKKAVETMKKTKIKGVSTERHVKIASPELEPADFEFRLPEGTTLKESLFSEVKFPDEEDVKEMLAVKMTEGIAGVGTIRTALRVYAARHGGVYPMLTGFKGDALAASLGIKAEDLEAKYFKAASYEVTSTPKGYTIKATLGTDTYIINQDDVESGTVKTE